MVEFKYNKKTGALEVWKDGVRIGRIETTGDKAIKEQGKKQKQE